MGKFKAIVFDLDNTLYPEIEYYEKAAILFAREKKIDEKSLIDVLHKVYYDGGDILGNILKACGLDENLQEEFFRCYSTVSEKLDLRQEVKDVLVKLKECGYKIFILTNGNPISQRNKVKCLGAERFVDGVIYAREFGQEKPSPVSLWKILQEWNLKATDVLVVGDDERCDGRLSACGVDVLVVDRFFDNPDMLWDILKEDE